MYAFIKIEYLAANSLVSLYEKKDIRSVSLTEIQNYGIKVRKYLKDKRVNAILLYSNIYTREFIEDYSDYFEFKGDSIRIRDGVTPDIIRRKILRYAPADVMLAMLQKESLSAIQSLR